MDTQKPALLIIEDDLDVADMLKAFFKGQGYQVSVANWGEDGVSASQAQRPEIIILDIRLPDIDGFEVAKRLHDSLITRDIPIIFLTEKSERNSRLKGLEMHAEDYITKPFDIQELGLKVNNTILRARRGSLVNAVTDLPESSYLDEHLRSLLIKNNWRLLIISLENLVNFRDTYGFVAADDLLRAVALILQDAIRQAGSPTDFLGQLTQADFLVSAQPENAALLKELIRRHLEQSFTLFYQAQDREPPPNVRLSVRISEMEGSQSFTTQLSELKTSIERFYRKGRT